MDTKRIIIDTDIGDDIDDALAIALAIKSPEIEVVGITTVFKNTEQRTQLTLGLLEALGGKMVKVCTGVGKPFVNMVDLNEIPCQCEALERTIPYANETHAVDFIIDTIKKDPSVLLVPIGPLTNIAVAILKAPETMKKAHIVLMGGVFENAYPEWNICCDPEAARIVLESGIDIKMVGLDVTTKCVLSDGDIGLINQNSDSESQFLSKLIEIWMNKSKHKVILHDPLVIGYLIDESILTFEQASIVVDLNGDYTRGATLIKRETFGIPCSDCNVEIATKVDNTRFTEMFMDRVFSK